MIPNLDHNCLVEAAGLSLQLVIGGPMADGRPITSGYQLFIMRLIMVEATLG